MTNTNNTSEPLYTRSLNPFNNGGEDVFASNSVITFYTYDYVLHENYKYEGAFTDQEGNLLVPGVYRDSDISEEGGEECYTIIIDWKAPLIQEVCEGKIKELNEKYGTDFHHRIITTTYGNLKKAGIIKPLTEEEKKEADDIVDRIVDRIEDSDEGDDK